MNSVKVIDEQKETKTLLRKTQNVREINSVLHLNNVLD